MIPFGVKSGLRAACNSVCLSVAAAVMVAAPAWSETSYLRGETQYIAALGDPMATSGTDAATWGLWSIDPGPRGVWIDDFQALIDNAGVAPNGWQFDQSAWWLEEHGLIMEAPVFPLPPGQYLVTGGREITQVLTVEPADASGLQAWSLDAGATIYDVTHLGCRAAIYRPQGEAQSCSPARTPTEVFPMSPGISMPAVDGCSKQEFQVLIVLGMMVESS